MLKLYLFAENICTKKIVTVSKANDFEKLTLQIKPKYFTDAKRYSFILVRITSTNYKPNSNIPLNYLGGPYKVLFTIFNINSNEEFEAKKDDPRNIQFVYITEKYLQKEITVKIKDLKTLASKALQDNLEKRPLAKKLIEDFI